MDRRRRIAILVGLGLAPLAALRSEKPAAPPAPAPPAAVPAFRQANTIGVLTIHGPIDGITLRSLERRVQAALDDGAEAIVLDIDTPGGELPATLDITHLVRTDMPANTVAWVNPNAYSAGAIIALACREIVVAPDAAMGDSAPISPFAPLPLTERAKAEAPILADVVHSARRNHYDENLVKAFVSVGVELWLLENAAGERAFVDRQEYQEIFGEEPPVRLTPVAPPARLQQAAPAVAPWFEKLMDVPQQGEAPPSPQEIQKQIEAEQDLPPSRTRLTAADRAAWRPLKQVTSNDTLLVVKSEDAIAYGLATAVVANDEQLKSYFGASALRRYDGWWSESVARFLMRPGIRAVLLVIFVVCFLIELTSPGFGVFGTTAAVSMLIFIGAPWLAGLAQWWEIALILIGLVLVAVELFVLPGFGVPGLAGVLCLLVGVIGTFVGGDVRSPAGQSQLLGGLVATFTAIAAAGVCTWLLFRQIEHLPLLRRLILRSEVGSPAPGGGGGFAPGGPGSGSTGLLEAMGPAAPLIKAGDIGVAETDLRLVGRASFAGRLVDVESIGPYIERGTPVRVVRVGTFSIEVEEAST